MLLWVYINMILISTVATWLCALSPSPVAQFTLLRDHTWTMRGELSLIYCHQLVTRHPPTAGVAHAKLLHFKHLFTRLLCRGTHKRATGEASKYGTFSTWWDALTVSRATLNNPIFFMGRTNRRLAATRPDVKRSRGAICLLNYPVTERSEGTMTKLLFSFREFSQNFAFPLNRIELPFLFAEDVKQYQTMFNPVWLSHFGLSYSLGFKMFCTS